MDELLMSVIDTIDTANHKRLELQQRIESLEEAKQQVDGSAAAACEKLVQHFDALRAGVCSALDRRLKELKDSVSEIEKEAAQPLHQCLQELTKDRDMCAALMQEGKELFRNCGDEPDTAKLTDFKNKSSTLDLNSLPEVPALQDVACIQVELPRDTTHMDGQLMEAIQDYGSVLARPPVIVTDTEQRPGALLVKWAEVSQNDDGDSTFDEFWLQYHQGALPVYANTPDTEFTTGYQGGASSTVVRKLRACEAYSFRVCGRTEGDDTWSPWSMLFIASGPLPCHEWQRVATYNVNETGQIAERCSSASGESSPWLFSSGSTFTCGHSINFHIEGMGDIGPDDGVMLCGETQPDMSPLSQGILFVSSAGKVFVDGQEKTTVLPALETGATLTLDSEILDKNKVRITAEIKDKVMTFDWIVNVGESEDAASAGGLGLVGALGLVHPKSSQELSLYFGIRFSSNLWKVRVE